MPGGDYKDWWFVKAGGATEKLKEGVFFCSTAGFESSTSTFDVGQRRLTFVVRRLTVTRETQSKPAWTIDSTGHFFCPGIVAATYPF